MRGIDLFAGAGGMALGAVAAGISIELAVENNVHAVQTYRMNHPGVRVFDRDIRRLKPRDLDIDGHGTVVFGGPPCKGFSTSNQRTRNVDNPVNHLYKEYMRVVRLVRPEWIVFENVPGIQETERGYFLATIKDALKRYGYSLSIAVLNAADYGVPQRRSRLFIIGSLSGKLIRLPDPLRTPPVSVAEALRDLPQLSNGANETELPYRNGTKPSRYGASLRRRLTRSTNHLVTRNAELIIERYKYVPPGGNWKDIPPRLMRNYVDRTRCHTGIYHRLDPLRPSKVIGNFRKNMLIHPSEHRGLSVREAARLQSFPDHYVFTGSVGLQQQQVGNAVPPLLSKVVFDALIRASG